MAHSTRESEPTPNRRHVLRAITIGIAGTTAGCSVEDTDGDGDPGGGDTDTATPTPSPRSPDDEPSGGTPTGTESESPTATGTDGTGTGGDEPIPVSGLDVGDLVITEIMIGPDAVSDAEGEWFELYVARSSPVDLDGLLLADVDGERHTVSGLGVAQPGAHVVFATSSGGAEMAGFAADYEYDDLTFGNTSDELLVTNGSVEIDRVEWDATWPVETGRSTSLDPSARNAADNDEADNWCRGETKLSGGDYGTPGAANRDCS